MDLRRSINTKIWYDPWFENLSINEKILWIYLLTNSYTNMLGVYEVSLKKISFETGIDLPDINKAFVNFEKSKKAKYTDNYVIILNWIKNQSFNSNMKTSAINVYNNLPTNIKIACGQVVSFHLGELKETISKDSKGFQRIPKKEKEIEKEIKIETEIESEDEIEIHNKIIQELIDNKIYLETFCMNEKIEMELLVSKLVDFKNKTILKGELKSDLNDAKSHFMNWLKYNRDDKPIQKPKSESKAEQYLKELLQENEKQEENNY